MIRKTASNPLAKIIGMIQHSAAASHCTYIPNGDLWRDKVMCVAFSSCSTIHLPQLPREPHTSYHQSQKRALAVASNNIAVTTSGQNSTTKYTTLPLNIYTYYQAYYHHKHHTPSSPYAAANHHTDYHPGYLSQHANANFDSHSLNQLTNPSAHCPLQTLL